MASTQLFMTSSALLMANLLNIGTQLKKFPHAMNGEMTMASFKDCPQTIRQNNRGRSN